MHMNSSFAMSRRAPTIGNGRVALTDDDIRGLAPSVFAETAHESRSERFAYIPTHTVLTAMRREGFVPMKAQQGKSRIEGKAEYTKHLIRFRRADAVAAPRLGQTFSEVVLMNAHDGTSAYKLMSGLFRLICLNGMVVPERMDGEIRIAHTGNVVDKVIEGSFQVIDDSNRALEAATAWAGVSLSRDETEIMARSARVIRFADANGDVETPITADQMLRARRSDDVGNDLWKTFNRLQENAIKGGISGEGRDANNRRRRVTTRAINGIDQDVRLNRALWMLGEEMAKLKGVAA